MQVEEDPTGGKFARSAGLLNSAAHKLEDVVNFHVGDMVTSLERATLQPGGREVLLYATIMGGIGGSPIRIASVTYNVHHSALCLPTHLGCWSKN